MKPFPASLLIVVVLGFLIPACTPTVAPAPPTSEPISLPVPTLTVTNATPVPSHTPTSAPSPTATTLPTDTPQPTSTPLPTATPSATPTPSLEEQIEVLRQTGIDLANAGQWEEAIDIFLQIIELDPDNGRTHNSLGLSYQQLGDFESAMTHFDQALALEPENAEWLVNRADAWADTGDMAAALADYDRAIELDPEVAHYFYNRALTYRRLGDSVQALANYDQAIALDPEFSYAYHNRANIHWDLGNLEQALADFDQALEIDPSDKLGFRNRGRLHLVQENLEAAHADFSEIINLCEPITFSVNEGSSQSVSFDANCTYAYLYLAELEYQLGNEQAALTNLETGVADNPSLAFDYYDRLATHYPNFGLAFFGRGLAQSHQGHIDEALADFTKAIQTGQSDPLHPAYLLARGNTYARQDNLEAAVADWQQTIFLAPDMADAYFNLAMAYEVMGDLEAAVNILATGITRDIPGEYQVEMAGKLLQDAEFLLNTSENAGQAELAVSMYALVTEEAPDFEFEAHHWNNLCWYASLQGLAADVMEACELAVAMEPENGSYRDSRGLARALIGDFAGAIEDFQYFIDWGLANQKSQTAINLRQEWIEALKNDINPFDETTLEMLRGG